jgi:hypothetical protein
MRDQPQDFEPLRRLLALKRHETPPPGYFRDFSSRVIDRIERESATPKGSWLTRLLALLRARPAISTSFCVASMLVLLAATTLFESNPAGPRTGLPKVEPRYTAMPAPTGPAAASAIVFVTNLEPAGLALEVTPPKFSRPPTNSLFDAPFYQRVEPVSFNQIDTLPRRGP